MDFIEKISKQENKNLAIDFDGVIHKNSKGFHDGTVYDEPIEEAYDALENLSKQYNLIIFSAKARTDRPLINNKTGVELIWEWLEKYNMKQFISEVVSEKPRALYYIDDKAIHFTDWKTTLSKIK
jgi:ribonucleotide monophosphatase NagD (HAD superfamily)